MHPTQMNTGAAHMLTFMLHHWLAFLLIVGTLALSRFAFHDVHNLEDDEDQGAR